MDEIATVLKPVVSVLLRCERFDIVKYIHICIKQTPKTISVSKPKYQNYIEKNIFLSLKKR